MFSFIPMGHAGFVGWHVFAAITLAVLPASAADSSGLRVTDPRCEMEARPLGLQTLQPRLSWKLEAAAAGLRDQHQNAYRILAASSLEKVTRGEADLWDSGRVVSSESIQVPYAGKKLVENQQVFWKVQAWDQADKPTDWSLPSQWSMGLFDNAAWTARWIGAPEEQETNGSIDVKFTIRKEAMSVYFRAEGADNACMWQINITGNRPRLVPHVRVNGAYRVLKEVPLSLPASAFSQPHTMRIVMAGNQIQTFLDGKTVDSTTEDSRHGYEIGLRASVSEDAIIHELTLKAPDGRVLYQSAKDVAVANQEIMLPGQSHGLTPMLRRDFQVVKQVRRAWVHATALGIYELHLNGQKVGGDFFAPGWTDYRKSVEYQTFDVTAMLHAGANAIGAQLAPGWFAGKIAWFGPARYGRTPRLLAQLQVEYEDGSSEVMVKTDDSWKMSDGPVVSADFQDGEVYDARREQPGWDQPAFKDTGWKPAAVVPPFEQARLVSQVDPPMEVLETLPALSVTEPRSGVYVYQLPRNITGVPRVKIRGTAGSTVQIRCSEAMNPDGSLNQKTQVQPGIANAFSNNTDTYTFSRTGEVVYQPHFTWRGFRFIEISGTGTKPALNEVTGLSIGSHVPNTGEVKTSDDLINRIFTIMKSSGQCAFISIPVDSPQRCERLGWTGDANFYLKTATFNFDVERFFTKWQDDVIHNQTAEGCFSNVSPGGWGSGADGGYGGGWGDVGVCLPHEIWRTYGDTGLVNHSYPAMVHYVEFLKGKSKDLIVPGDLAPAGDWQNRGDGTPGDFIASAYFAYDVKLLADMARALGKTGDAVNYDALFGQIRSAIQTKWIDASGRVASGSQTAQVMALHIGLVPDAVGEAAGKKLAENVEAHHNHLTTGFVGTQWLLPVLTDIGRSDLAFAILRQTDSPSWGYMVSKGSTTIWENWDVVNADGTIRSGPNSLNHCALGTAGEWIYRNIGGIDQEPASTGFSHLVIRPRLEGRLTGASARFESVHGVITTDWKSGPAGFGLKVTVPVNTTATIHIPTSNPAKVMEGKVTAISAPAVRYLKQEAGCALYAVGSGTYEFTAP